MQLVVSKKSTPLKDLLRVLKVFFGAQLFFAVMILSFNFGGAIVFSVIAALPPIIAWSGGGKKNYRFILYFLCMAFVIGQRTFYIGSGFRIVPSAVILWVLAVTCLKVKPQYTVARKPIPGSVILLCAASFWGIFLALLNDLDLNLASLYTHMMVMAIPAFFVAYKLVQRMDHIKMIANIISLGAIFLSFLGISEYFGLGFVHLFSSYIKGNTVMGQGNFTRMVATFWGGPMIVGHLTMCLPISLSNFFISKTWIQRFISLLSVVLSFVAIYLSGYRGVWLPALLSIGVYFYLKGAKGIMILILLMAIGINFIPQAAKNRFAGVAGKHRDSSSIKREHRALDAWALIQKAPIQGHGWGASGLVHSDYLQIWADTGLPGLLGFCFCFISIFKRLSSMKTKDKETLECSRGFISSTAGAGMILVAQTWMNLPENYTPFWVILGVAYQLPNVAIIEKKILYSQLVQTAPDQTKETEQGNSGTEFLSPAIQ